MWVRRHTDDSSAFVEHKNTRVGSSETTGESGALEDVRDGRTDVHSQGGEVGGPG